MHGELRRTTYGTARGMQPFFRRCLRWGYYRERRTGCTYVQQIEAIAATYDPIRVGTFNFLAVLSGALGRLLLAVCRGALSVQSRVLLSQG